MANRTAEGQFATLVVPCASALSSLGQRFGDLVWKLLFEEVRKVTLGELGGFGMDDSQFRDKDEEIIGQSDDDPWEEEKSWHDPSAHNVRRAVILWDNFEKGRNRPVRVNFILIVQNEGIKIFLFSGPDCSGTV